MLEELEVWEFWEAWLDWDDDDVMEEAAVAAATTAGLRWERRLPSSDCSDRYGAAGSCGEAAH